MSMQNGKSISTLAMVNSLKASEEDFEWYPTTDEMIQLIKSDIEDRFIDHISILECGAGDGRVLKALTEGDRFAIEKSKLLLESLDSSIFVVGTDF
ncbi:MAG: hypothetical protein EOP48_34820, partial [Sphingobacteriales bacterium]